jgi:hypothetical protein
MKGFATAYNFWLFLKFWVSVASFSSKPGIYHYTFDLLDKNLRTEAEIAATWLKWASKDCLDEMDI